MAFIKGHALETPCPFGSVPRSGVFFGEDEATSSFVSFFLLLIFRDFYLRLLAVQLSALPSWLCCGALSELIASGHVR